MPSLILSAYASAVCRYPRGIQAFIPLSPTALPYSSPTSPRITLYCGVCRLPPPPLRHGMCCFYYVSLYAHTYIYIILFLLLSVCGGVGCVLCGLWGLRHAMPCLWAVRVCVWCICYYIVVFVCGRAGCRVLFSVMRCYAGIQA
jgi:hypothetical protein